MGRQYFLNDSECSNANEFPRRSNRHCPDVAFTIFRNSSNGSNMAAVCPPDLDETPILVNPELIVDTYP
jgi:hypothetical protein